MNKLLVTLFAAASLITAGSVAAADNTQSTSPNSPAASDAPTQQERIPAQGGTGSSAGGTPGADSSNPNTAGEIENLPLAAALKKCDALSGQKKDDCVSAANKKFGQM